MVLEVHSSLTSIRLPSPPPSQKINQKNSWSLNLIDYISDVLDVETGEVTNFQVASCTLDASVKIYSYRVDSIHSEVCGHFARLTIGA